MNTRAARIIQAAHTAGQTTLSEYDSKRVLKLYGVPTSKEVLVTSQTAARTAASKIGYPVVLKACSAVATHKTPPTATQSFSRTTRTRAPRSHQWAPFSRSSLCARSRPE